MRYCKKCLNPETRPRITFDKNNVCNACMWAEKKKAIDWNERQDYFRSLCDKYQACIVPFSGGKDSVYVAYKMRKFGIKDPILVTVLPHMETEIGKWNRENCCRTFQRVEIKLQDDKYRALAKKYFIEEGKPKHPWETAISATIINQAVKMGVPLIVYGEDGEQEYGGAGRDNWKDPISKEWLMKYYYHDHLDWTIPSSEDFEKIFFTQYSKFENWNSLSHAAFAEASGMKVRNVRSVGTLENRSQISDKLQDLHMFLCFLKFGFGRSTSDSGILIRNGLETRSMCLLQTEKYDGEYPVEYHQEYLDYFDMTDRPFWGVLRSHVDWNMIDETGDFGAYEVQGVVISRPFILKQKWIELRRNRN